MKLFAVDLGNRQVKMKSEKGIKVFPSYYVEASEYGNRDILKFAKEKTNTSDYTSVRDEFTYVWGEGLEVKGKLVTDTIGFDGRYNTLYYKLLVDFALAEMARDYSDEIDGIIDVTVVTGVPTDDFNKEEVLTQISKAFKGDHSVTIDGVSITVRVKDVYALPQPVGTVINYLVDGEGNVGDTPLSNSYVGVVDVGGGTVIIDALDSMNLDSTAHAQMEEGAFTLYSNIRNELIKEGHRINEYDIEALVRSGNDLEKYLWSPNGITTLDFTNIIMRERKKYTRKIASVVNSTYKAYDHMFSVIVTGGAANLLIKDEFTAAVRIAEFSANSEVANVNGFYKFGLAEGLIE